MGLNISFSVIGYWQWAIGYWLLAMGFPKSGAKVLPQTDKTCHKLKKKQKKMHIFVQLLIICKKISTFAERFMMID